MMQPDFDFNEPQQQQWKEVPQARFLSWSRGMQMAYCAARDKHSAILQPDFADFYLTRAATYKEQQ